jgi:hypothetical protein
MSERDVDMRDEMFRTSNESCVADSHGPPLCASSAPIIVSLAKVLLRRTVRCQSAPSHAKSHLQFATTKGPFRDITKGPNVEFRVEERP